MKTLPVVKPGNASSSTSKTKKNAREKRKAQPSTSKSSTTTNSEQNAPKSLRSHVGFGPNQLAAIIEQTTGEQLSDEIATAFVEDVNYKLRLLINDALTKARLSSRRGISLDDLNDTFECLGVEKIYGATNKPSWQVIPDPSGQNIHYLDDPEINIFDMAELEVAFVEPCDSVITRSYIPQTDDSHKAYFESMCKAIVDEDKDLRAVALKDIKTNCSIGPIIGWFYNFSYKLLVKDVTFSGLTSHVLELIECLETNPVSGLVVTDMQLHILANLLFQRLSNAIRNVKLVKPMCHLLTFMCRRTVLRKLILIKMITKYAKLKNIFAFPMICLANEFGIDGVASVIVPNLKHILHIVRLTKEPGYVMEALRAYYILCGAGTHIESICNQFYDIFADGIIPYWSNQSYVGNQVDLEYNWFNVKRELCKSMRKILPPPQYKQKKISMDDVFLVYDYGLISGAAQIKHKTRQRDKMQRIHPTNFTPIKKETHVIIGKRTLLAKVLSSKVKKPVCTYHTMMYHNL